LLYIYSFVATQINNCGALVEIPKVKGKIKKVHKFIAFLKTLQRLKQEWHKSPALGPGKQTAKTLFGLEK
jgi:hypothetical protein